MKTIKNRTSVNIFLALLFIMTACSERKVDPRYTEAETLTADWCIETQIDVSGLKADSLNSIQMTSFDTYQGLMTKYPKYDASQSKPISIVSYTSKMTNNTVMTAPEEISKETMCKIVGTENLKANMPDVLTADAANGTCRQMNEKALAWALSQLTDKELENYNTQGKKLYFSDDIVTTGSAFYGTCSEFDATDNPYTLSAAAQMLPYSNSDPRTGSHYCKLISPSQALFWVLDRAYRDDPLGKGLEKSDNASLACDIKTASGDCMLKDTEILGSCIFYMAVAGINMCVDYTGKNFAGDLSNPLSGQSNCAGPKRPNGKFSTDSCATRSDLNQGTNFESYKGMCVLNCGNEDTEYRFNVYNDTGGDPATNCPPASGMWYPPFK